VCCHCFIVAVVLVAVAVLYFSQMHKRTAAPAAAGAKVLLGQEEAEAARIVAAVAADAEPAG